MSGAGIIETLKQACANESGLLTIVNMDNFILFNDIYGAEMGDKLIEECVKIIDSVTEGDDIKARLGGDEFLIVLKANKEVLNKRLFYFDSLIENWHNDKIKNISVSYGYCSAADYDNPTFEGLISKADEFMYKMKNDYYEKTDAERRKD